MENSNVSLELTGRVRVFTFFIYNGFGIEDLSMAPFDIIAFIALIVGSVVIIALALRVLREIQIAHASQAYLSEQIEQLANTSKGDPGRPDMSGNSQKLATISSQIKALTSPTPHHYQFVYQDKAGTAFYTANYLHGSVPVVPRIGEYVVTEGNKARRVIQILYHDWSTDPQVLNHRIQITLE